MNAPARGLPSARTVAQVASVAAREVAVTLRSGMWPIARLFPLPPPSEGHEHPPVVLVHGYMGHPEMLRPLTRRLYTEGWSDVRRVGYPSLTATFEEVIDAIAATVIAAARDHGGKVDLVGHSLGALAARAWIKLYGGDAHVRRFVSLGGPHDGTALHTLVPSPVGVAFDPGGPWVTRIREGDEPVPTTVVRAAFDHQVYPPTRARIRGTYEVVVHAWGHNGLLWSDEAHDAVVESLTLRD